MDQPRKAVRRVHVSLHRLTLERLDKLADELGRTRSETLAWLINEEHWRHKQRDPRDP